MTPCGLTNTDDQFQIPRLLALHTRNWELALVEKAKYPQSREFDEQDRPVRDIDHTDHGRPDLHTNPHQHRYLPDPTGGTPQRGPSEPLPSPPELPRMAAPPLPTLSPPPPLPKLPY